MKISRLVMLMLMVTVPATAAESKTKITSCLDTGSGMSMSAVPADTSIPPFLTGGGGLSPSASGEDTQGNGEVLTCEWFWIQCYDGYTDECCGSLNSCWDYCEEVCGGPCEYIPNEQ